MQTYLSELMSQYEEIGGYKILQIVLRGEFLKIEIFRRKSEKSGVH